MKAIKDANEEINEAVAVPKPKAAYMLVRSAALLH
jgi:hypothetical protein